MSEKTYGQIVWEASWEANECAIPYSNANPGLHKLYQTIAEAVIAEYERRNDSSIMPTPDRQLLRNIVDAAWQYCTESETVPATDWADLIIDGVLQKTQ